MDPQSLRKLMKAAGLTDVGEFADAVRVDDSAVRKWLKGTNKVSARSLAQMREVIPKSPAAKAELDAFWKEYDASQIPPPEVPPTPEAPSAKKETPPPLSARIWFLAGVGSAALALLLFGLLWAMWRSSASEASLTRDGIADPLPGQMRPPCPRQYVEDSGGCWDEFAAMTPEGKPKPCPQAPYVREVRGADGRVRCRIAVMAPSRNSDLPGGP